MIPAKEAAQKSKDLYQEKIRKEHEESERKRQRNIVLADQLYSDLFKNVEAMIDEQIRNHPSEYQDWIRTDAGSGDIGFINAHRLERELSALGYEVEVNRYNDWKAIEYRVRVAWGEKPQNE